MVVFTILAPLYCLSLSTSAINGRYQMAQRYSLAVTTDQWFRGLGEAIRLAELSLQEVGQ
jgi:hypothetical protein